MITKFLVSGDEGNMIFLAKRFDQFCRERLEPREVNVSTALMGMGFQATLNEIWKKNGCLVRKGSHLSPSQQESLRKFLAAVNTIVDNIRDALTDLGGNLTKQ